MAFTNNDDFTKWVMGGLMATVVAGGCIQWFRSDGYRNSNKNEIGIKRDGLFGKTIRTVSKTEYRSEKDPKITVQRTNWVGEDFLYVDYDGDGRVDKLVDAGGEHLRHQHFDMYREAFEEADKDLGEQNDRFRELFKYHRDLRK